MLLVQTSSEQIQKPPATAINLASTSSSPSATHQVSIKGYTHPPGTKFTISTTITTLWSPPPSAWPQTLSLLPQLTNESDHMSRPSALSSFT